MCSEQVFGGPGLRPECPITQSEPAPSARVKFHEHSSNYLPPPTREEKKKKSRLCNLKLSHTGYCAPLQHETRQRCSFTSTWSSAPLTVSQYVRQLGLCYQLGHPLPEEEAEVDPGPDGSSLFKQLQATTAKSCSNNLVSVFCLTL